MRVLIVNDHAVVRAGTCLVLQKFGNFVCNEAFDYSDALNKAHTGGYDVMLVGLSLPELRGFETLDLVKREKPDLPVVVVSMHADQQHALKTYALSGDAYIDDKNSTDDLILAIEKVVRGEKYVSEHLINWVLAELLVSKTDIQSASRKQHLSKREEQVAELLVSGATSKEIAWQLSLSVKTVSTYKKRVLEKLNIRNLVELVKCRVKGWKNIPDVSRGAPAPHQ